MQTVTDGTELQDFRLTVGVCAYLAIFARITVLGMNPVILLCYKDVSDPRPTSFLVSHWENIKEKQDTCRVCGGGSASGRNLAAPTRSCGVCFAAVGERTGWKERLLWSEPRKAGGRKPRLLSHEFDNFTWTAWHVRWRLLCPDQARRGAAGREGGREAACGVDRCSAKRRQGLGSLATQKYGTQKVSASFFLNWRGTASDGALAGRQRGRSGFVTRSQARRLWEICGRGAPAPRRQSTKRIMNLV